MSPSSVSHLLTQFFVATLCSLALAQDPVKVSPDHYSVELDNEFVRVLRSKGDGRAKTPMHEHPANVVVYLTDADVRVVGPEGEVKDSHRKRGDVIWNGPQKHERINLSDRPYELIQFELKAKPSGASVPPALEPLKVSPGQYAILVENEHVRVIRSRGGPRAKAGLHAHPPYVSVALTALHIRRTDEAGNTRDVKRAAGSISPFNPSTRHAEENISDEPFESILVEFKTK